MPEVVGVRRPGPGCGTSHQLNRVRPGPKKKAEIVRGGNGENKPGVAGTSPVWCVWQNGQNARTQCSDR